MNKKEIEKKYKKFIDDLVQNFDEFTTSDLQGVIEAKCFNKNKTIIENMELSDIILDLVYEKVQGR